MEDSLVGNPRSDANFPLLITSLPASARQSNTAPYAFSIAAVLVAVVMPFANVPLARIDAFVPVVQTITCIADLLTATFLFAQYSVQPHRALLALASGFGFGGLFAFLQTLAFPDAYVRGVVIGDALSSAGWLFVCWHTSFFLAVILYALLKDSDDATRRSARSARVTISVTLACVIAATAGLTWGATAGAGYLPSLYKTATDQAPFAFGVNVYLALLSATAIALVFLRRRTILDQWLIVTLLAWLPNYVVSIAFTVVRFTLGWYTSRVFALLAGSSLLAILIAETLLLYSRLANAVVLLRRSEQRQRLLTDELSHRVKNVLAEVAGIAKSTRRNSDSIDDFVRSLDGRIQSMAAAHTLLSKSGWRSVSLDALVRTELAPYMTGGNIGISGPDVMLSPAEIQALAMVLHELATNAAKYGALSTPDGQISVNWELKPNGRAANLDLEWRELGGPPVASEVRSSYGTSLIRQLIPHELGGNVDLVLAPDGVSCKFEFPIARRGRSSQERD